MRPAFRLLIDGVDVTQSVARGLVSITVTDEAGFKSDEAVIVFTDAERRYRLPRRNQKVAVELGFWNGAVKELTAVGAFVIRRVSLRGAARTITITARAADTAGELSERKTRGWDVTLGGVVSAIAAEHGLTAAVGASLKELAIGHQDQVDESDAHFLTRMARDVGALFKVQDGYAVMVERGRGVKTSGLPIAAETLDISEVADDYTFDIEDRDEAVRAAAFWLDTATGKRVRVDVGAESGRRITVPGASATEAEARRKASAALAGARLANQKASVTASGRPSVTSGAPIDLTGFDDDMDGRWIVDTARHELGDGPFITALSLTRPSTA